MTDCIHGVPLHDTCPICTIAMEQIELERMRASLMDDELLRQATYGSTEDKLRLQVKHLLDVYQRKDKENGALRDEISAVRISVAQQVAEFKALLRPTADVDDITKLDVIVDYTNWRGERRERRIRPIEITFGSNRWHNEPQWLLMAMDLENNCHRIYAIRDIHSWRPADDR